MRNTINSFFQMRSKGLVSARRPNLRNGRETGADLQIGFEPIYNLKLGRVTGYEATGFQDHDPSWDHYDQDREQLFKQEMYYRSLALSKMLQFGLGRKDIFLNVNPLVIKDPSYQAGKTREHIAGVGLKMEQVYLSFSEKAMLESPSDFSAAVENYRRQGYRIVIKNFGYDYSESKMDLVSDLRPEVLKVDRFFVSGLNESPLKQAYLRSLKFLADGIGVQIIADGVETDEELNVIQRMGITYVQGPILNLDSFMHERSRS